MAYNVGTRLSYQGNAYSGVPPAPQVHVIADLIDNVDPTEFGFLKWLGIGEKGQGGESKTRSMRITRKGRMLEWMSDTLLPDSDALAVTQTNVATSFTATTANVWRAGDIVKIENEYELVTSVSGTTINVTRAQFGSSAVQHTVGTITVYRITRAALEGGTPASGNTTDIGTDLNYTQIFEDRVDISGTDEVVDHMGFTDAMDYQTFKKFQELLRDLNRTLYHGIAAAGNSTTRRTMGGLMHFVTAAKGSYVANLASAALVPNDIENAMQSIRASSGKLPDVILCDMWAQRKISSFGQSYIRTERTESTVGNVIDTFVTQQGPLKVMVDIFNPTGNLWLLRSEDMAVYPLRPFAVKPLAMTGDYTPVFIVGEYSFVLKNPKAFGRLHTYSTSA